MKAYEIEIRGTTHRTQIADHETVWDMVDRLMVDQPANTVPTVRDVTPKRAPVVVSVATPPALVEPAPVVTVAPVAVVAGPAPVDAIDATPPPPAGFVRGSTIDPVARERTERDAAALRSAGFAVKRPLFDRGTMVVDLGVKNARKARAEFDALPTVDEATRGVEGAVLAEERRDVEGVPLGTLAMRDTGAIVGPGGVDWSPEERALGQLAARLGVPQPAYLFAVWPALRSMNWNQMVATAIGHERSTCPTDHPIRQRLDADKLIRARLRSQRGTDTPAMYAAVTDTYTPLDCDRVAALLREGLAHVPGMRCEATYDGNRATFDCLAHTTVAPERFAAGEVFRAGIRVSTSDDGGGSIAVSALYWQNLCLNLIILDKGEFSLARLRHVGEERSLVRGFARALREAEGKIGHFLKAWNFATGEALATPMGGNVVRPAGLRFLDEMPESATLTVDDLLAGIFLGLGKTGAVQVGRDDLPGLLAAHARDESGAVQLAPVTRASVVNAITRYAHEGAGRVDLGRGQELERMAGALLVGSRGGHAPALPFLPAARELARA